MVEMSPTVTIYRQNGAWEENGVILGRCVYGPCDGWRFIPNVFGRKPSKKYWPTWEECLPRWTGGLDGTSSK